MDRRSFLQVTVAIPLVGLVVVEELPDWVPFVGPEKYCEPGDYAESEDPSGNKRTWLILKACHPIGICRYGLIIEVDGHARMADSSFVIPVSEAYPV